MQNAPSAFTSTDAEALKKAVAQRRATAINPLQARNYYKDGVLVKMAADAGVLFEINLAPVISLPAAQRAQTFREIRIFLEKCVKYKAKVKIFTASAEPLDIKSPRELQAIATEILGLEQNIAKTAVTR